MHPHLLPHVTPIVTSALTNPELSLAATMALKDISRDCTDSMKPYAEQVISSIQQSVSSGSLAMGECVRQGVKLFEMGWHPNFIFQTVLEFLLILTQFPLSWCHHFPFI